MHLPFPRQQRSVPRQSRGITAIHGIDSILHRTQNRRLVSNSQQMPRFFPSIHTSITPIPILIHHGHHPLQQLHQLLAILPQTTPNGISIKWKRRQIFQTLLPQIPIQPTMNDTINGLFPNILQMLHQTPRLPTMSPLHGIFQNLRIDMIRRQFVQGNNDIGAKRLLSSYGTFGSQRNFPPVSVGTEDDPLFRDFYGRPRIGIGGVCIRRFFGRGGRAFQFPAGAQLLVHGTVGETEDLEAAAVGDERTARPIDEFVKSSGSFDDVGSGLEEEVVSVAEYELLVGGVGVSEVYSFEGCVCCDCDVSRRVNDTMRRVYSSDTSQTLLRLVQNFKTKEISGFVRPRWEGRWIRRRL
mmetsp:Transcript_5733/g.11713  ORF Transcript_5733/g.11713 Transcript_5733/m.11713 type:complete len:354 (+) Transcript_5733:282-1343(+)